MPKSPALLLSGLFHPLLVPTYMFLLAVLVDPFAFGSGGLGDFRSLGTLLMIVLYTCIIPAISVFIMLKLEMVNSIMMEDRMERVGPLLLVMILYFWVYYNLSQHNDTPRFFIATLLGVVIALAVAFVINVVDKISLHAVGMGGLAGMVLILTGMYGGGRWSCPCPGWPWPR